MSECRLKEWERRPTSCVKGSFGILYVKPCRCWHEDDRFCLAFVMKSTVLESPRQKWYRMATAYFLKENVFQNTTETKIKALKTPAVFRARVDSWEFRSAHTNITQRDSSLSTYGRRNKHDVHLRSLIFLWEKELQVSHHRSSRHAFVIITEFLIAELCACFHK